MTLIPEDNIILIGKKPIINYVSGITYQFLQMNAEQVILKAGGKYMGRAIEVAEAATKKFLKGIVEIKSFTSDSSDDEFKGTTIEIVLTKIQNE